MVALVENVGEIARSDPWLCAEMLRGGVLGQLVRVLHSMHVADKAVPPADDAAGVDIPCYAITKLLPCFASVYEVWAKYFMLNSVQSNMHACSPCKPAPIIRH